MQQFLLLFALCCIVVNGKPQKRQIGQISYGSNGCTITGDELYQNGQLVRKLTPQEQQQIQQFQVEMQQWGEEFSRRMSNFDPFTNSKVDTPVAPQPPSNICPNNGGVNINSGNYNYNGCSVTGDKVYINGKYVRDLTAQEKQQMADFQSGMQRWQQNFQQNMQQYQRQVQEATRNFNPLRGDTLQLPPAPSGGGGPQPTAPAICMSFGG